MILDLAGGSPADTITSLIIGLEPIPVDVIGTAGLNSVSAHKPQMSTGCISAQPAQYSNGIGS